DWRFPRPVTARVAPCVAPYACPRLPRNEKPLQRGASPIGAARFELATFGPPDRRANQAAPRPARPRIPRHHNPADTSRRLPPAPSGPVPGAPRRERAVFAGGGRPAEAQGVPTLPGFCEPPVQPVDQLGHPLEPIGDDAQPVLHEMLGLDAESLGEPLDDVVR